MLSYGMRRRCLTHFKMNWAIVMDMKRVTTEELARVQSWAEEKIAQGSEPPWAWYQYMKLIEAINAIAGGRTVTQPTEASQRPEPRQGGPLRLVGSANPQDSAQCYSADPSSLPLPM